MIARGMLARSAVATMVSLCVIALIACVSGTSAGSVSGQASSCASLKTLPLKEAHIEVAEAIVPNPVWPFPAFLGSALVGPDAGVRTPFCRIAGVIEDEIAFEVWLPEQWNGRLEAVGNTAFVGTLMYPAAAAALARGSAAATSDLGHRSKGGYDTSWAVGRPDRIDNYGRRAHHLVAVTAKQIVLARYGRPQEYAYFSGCSAGGWQGLTEAQLYPDDYQGILAMAPANNQVRANTTSLWRDEHFPNSERLATEQVALVTAAAVARCDAGDGVTDGIISAPESCSFDPRELLCKAGDAAGQCLTPPQLQRVQLLFGRRNTAAGLALYPGYAWGTAFQDTPFLTASDSLTVLAGGRYAWSPKTFDFDRDVPRIEAEIGTMLGRSSPDLRAFASSGGKIILTQGWTDPIVSPYNTIDYFTAVRAKMGVDKVQDFARLYMAPGMAHCGGGVGPDSFDALPLLQRWVEVGVPPDRLIAAKLGPGGRPTRTRPLCPFPQIAVYDGKGDSDSAGNFMCKVP